MGRQGADYPARNFSHPSGLSGKQAGSPGENRRQRSEIAPLELRQSRRHPAADPTGGGSANRPFQENQGADEFLASQYGMRRGDLLPQGGHPLGNGAGQYNLAGGRTVCDPQGNRSPLASPGKFGGREHHPRIQDSGGRFQADIKENEKMPAQKKSILPSGQTTLGA